MSSSQGTTQQPLASPPLSSSSSSDYGTVSSSVKALNISFSSPDIKYVDDPYDNRSDIPSSSSDEENIKTSPNLQNLTRVEPNNDNNEDTDLLTKLPSDPSVHDILSLPVKLPSDVTFFRKFSHIQSKPSFPFMTTPVTPRSSRQHETITDPISFSSSDSATQTFYQPLSEAAAISKLNTSMHIFLSLQSPPDKATISMSFDTIINLLRHSSLYHTTLATILLDAIFSTIVKHPADVSLHTRTTLFLSSVTEHSLYLSQRLALADGISHLIMLLRTHQKHPVIQSRLLATLTPVCRHIETFETFTELKGIELVVWTLDNFCTLRPVVTHAASILRLVAQHGGAVNRTRIARVGALSALSSALCRWTVAPTVQTNIVASIAAIVLTSKTNQWIAGYAMAVEPVISAMRNNPHDTLFQIVAADCVYALCEHEFTNRVRALDADFLSVAIDSLKLFGEDVSVANSFFTALCYLKCDNESLQNAFAKPGTVEVIMQVVQLHQTHVMISVNAMRCLGYALTSAMCRDELALCNGVDLLIEIILEGVGCLNIVQQGLYTLGFALFDSKANAKRLYDINGIHVVVDAMERYMECPIVQKHAFHCLMNATNSTPITSGYGVAIRTVGIVMMGHCENEKIQDLACELLMNMTRTSESLVRLREDGLSEILKIIRNCHEGNESIQQKSEALIQFVRTGGTVWQQVERLSGSFYDRLRPKGDIDEFKGNTNVDSRRRNITRFV